MKVGRPKALIPRNKHINLLVTEFEFKKIADVAKKFNISKTEAIVRGINLLDSSKPKILKSQLKPKKSKKILPIINPDENQ